MKNIKTIDCRRPSLLFLPLCVFFVLMIMGTMAEVKAQVIINDDFSSPASLANWTQVQTQFNGGTYNIVGGNLQLYTSGGSSGFWGQPDVMEIKAIYPTMPSNFCNIEFSLNLEQVSIVQYGANKSNTGVNILIGDGSNSTSIQNGIFIELHGFYSGYSPDFPYPYNVWSGNRLSIWEIIGGVSTRIGYIDYTPFVLANIDIKIVHQNNVWKVLHKQSFETTYNTVNIPTFNAISGLNFIARISSGDGGFTMQNAMGSVNISNFTVTQLGLNPPASVTASALNSNSIKLDWVDNVCNETAFKIQRSLTSGSGFADIGTVAANVTTFTNTGLTAGTTYYYRVIATNGAGDSAPSNEANANTLNFGLLAYYPFSGNANDASGNGNNGTVNGATLTTDRFCNPNGAYSFNGVSDYIEVANSPSLEGVTSLSICGWVRPNGVYGTGYIPILEKSSTTLNGLYYLGIYQDGTDYYYYGSLQNNFYRADLITPLVLSDWYYFTAIFTGTTAEYYLNNQLVAVTSQSVIGGFTTNDVLRIGANPAGITEFLNGTLDEVRIYNRALSASEVATLYDLPAAPSLLSCYHLFRYPSQFGMDRQRKQ